MSKRKGGGVFWFVVGGLLGAVGGAGAMLIAFPYLFPPPTLNESVNAMDAAATVAGESRFREDAPGQDAVHWARGGVRWYRASDGKVLLELQGDFEAGAGPNYWIYLNTQADIDDESDFLDDQARVKLAKLRSFSGSQVYEADAGAFAGARALTIWCETFGQYIASANIPPARQGL